MIITNDGGLALLRIKRIVAEWCGNYVAKTAKKANYARQYAEMLDLLNYAGRIAKNAIA